MEGPFTGEGFDVEVDGPLMGLEGGEEDGFVVEGDKSTKVGLEGKWVG